MEPIKKHDRGAAVEDVQQRLAKLGYLTDCQINGYFGDDTIRALHDFCSDNQLDPCEQVDRTVWAVLVDLTFNLGGRALYLRIPYFHGNDVRELQHALSALGFGTGEIDGFFGVHTEHALRKFQSNMGLPSDGIAGAYTYTALFNLQHSWEGKDAIPVVNLGFARAANVLESNALCLFGTDGFTRSVASRMSNLALATNPMSRIVSADSLLVPPDNSMLLVQIVLPEVESAPSIPRVTYEDESSLAIRLKTALGVAESLEPPRLALELPGMVWLEAGADRSAQHFAITLLDALCTALS